LAILIQYGISPIALVQQWPNLWQFHALCCSLVHLPQDKYLITTATPTSSANLSINIIIMFYHFPKQFNQFYDSIQLSPIHLYRVHFCLNLQSVHFVYRINNPNVGLSFIHSTILWCSFNSQILNPSTNVVVFHHPYCSVTVHTHVYYFANIINVPTKYMIVILSHLPFTIACTHLYMWLANKSLFIRISQYQHLINSF